MYEPWGERRLASLRSACEPLDCAIISASSVHQEVRVRVRVDEGGGGKDGDGGEVERVRGWEVGRVGGRVGG